MDHRVVEEHLDPIGVRDLNELNQLLLRPEARLRSLRPVLGPLIERPIAVVARERMGTAARERRGRVLRARVAVRVVERDRDPERVHAEGAEIPVLDPLRDARPVAALPVARLVGPGKERLIIRWISVVESIDEREVHHRVAPVECPARGSDIRARRSDAATVERNDPRVRRSGAVGFGRRAVERRRPVAGKHALSRVGDVGGRRRRRRRRRSGRGRRRCSGRGGRARRGRLRAVVGARSDNHGNGKGPERTQRKASISFYDVHPR